MGYETLEVSFSIADPETGETSPLGWVDDSGIAFEDIKTVSSFQEMTISFSTVGHTAEKTMRILMGLPYKHPRQILHNGRKP